MKKKDKVEEQNQNEKHKEVKDINYYHNILNKDLIISMIIFGCFFCFYVYTLGEKVTNIHIEALFKAFFLIFFNLILFLNKHITSKSFGILCLIDSIIILVIAFAFGPIEVLYPFVAIPILIHSILFLRAFKKEEITEELISDKKVFVSLIPVIILLIVFLLFVFLKKKALYSILIGLLFMGSFNAAGDIICAKYIKKNKALLTIISIVFSILYIAYGVLVYLD